MQKKLLTSYEISHDGIIFEIVRTQIIDDDGSILSPGLPHRTPHHPAMRVNTGKAIVIVPNEAEFLPPGVKLLAGVIWTKEITTAALAAENARLAAEGEAENARLAAEGEAAKAAQKRTAKTQ